MKPIKSGFGVLAVCAIAVAANAQNTPGDERALPFRLEQDAVSKLSPRSIEEIGRYLFSARFTVLDGAGRPGSTGSGQPTRRPTINAKTMLRTSGPDANSCASCHNEPSIGGAGAFTANVFVGAQEREPVLESVSSAFSAERKTPSMFGSGLIELAAREMTQDLHAIRRKTVEEAARTGHRAELPLVTKGVSFGRIGADPNGTVLTEAIEGIDKDLVVRPWSQKGVVTSLRTFTVTALNHHHGMQATERFGIRLTGSRDFDRDGVEDEIREGEVTALTLFQATLPAPGPVPTTSERSRGVLALGRALFERVECTGCHLPALPLRSTVYVEPGPFNLEGTLRQSEATSVVEVDVAASEWGVRLPRDAQGRVLVEAFTDLKRHKIADPETPRLANEIVSQGFSSTDEFLTKRLWEVGSSLGSYGHRGDITTIREVILAHGGEARTSRLKFVALDATEQASVIEFLKSMRTPSVPAPQDPPNVISQSMWSALVEVGALPDSNAGADLLASATYDRILTRAIAAADRAEHTLARLRSLSARIDHERSKAGQAALQVASHSLVSDPPSRISGVLGDLLSSSGLDQRPQIPGLVEQVMRAENATLQAIDTAGHALAAATFAGADPIPITPIGYIPAASVFRSLEDATSNGDVEKVLVELAAWCEDLAFRVEQLGQQVSTAALRAEAFARASQTRGKPPELATR